jgi:SAM-dependent methyltransferase
MRDAYTEARAKEYVNIYGPPDAPRPIYLNRMKEIASLVPDGSVLDVACGVGHLYGQLRREDYLGVDSSPYMIDIAQRYFPGAHFRVVDAFELKTVEPRRTVVSSSFFIHLEPIVHQLMLQNMWDSCTDRLIFTIPILYNGVTFTHTEGQEAKTLITTISQETFNELCARLTPAPAVVFTQPFSAGSFGYDSGDRLVMITK